MPYTVRHDADAGNGPALEDTDHFGAAFDPVAFQVAFNSLYPDRANHIACHYVAPVIH